MARPLALVPALLAAGCLAGPAPADGPPEGAPSAPAPTAWPADGTWGVPAALPLAAIHFPAGTAPEDPAAATRLEAAGGARVPASVAETPCADLAFGPGRCVVLRPEASLAAATAHRMVVDLPGGSRWVSRFATAPAGPQPEAEWAPFPCAIDEQGEGPACVLSSEGRLTVRVRASAPVRLWLALGGGHEATAVAARGDAILRVGGLPPDHAFDATLTSVDLAGRRRTLALTLHTTPPLPPLFITEVRADPAGPEPAQEYVEVVNSGCVPVDLTGFALSDAPDDEGDVITGPAVAPAGGRVLLVADRFDPTGPDDDPVPPGVLLVRMGSSLGSGGLSNSGEPVFLRDPAGRRLSAAPALAPPGSGVCLVRASTDGRTGDPAAFAFDAASGCTPGTPDRVP